MQKKQLIFNLQGMAQDVLKPEINNRFAYTINNMRLVATKDSNLLSLATEKGTLQLNTAQCLESNNGSFVPVIRELKGKFLGSCILNDNLILFTKDTDVENVNPDYIYKLYFHDYGNGNDDLANNRISYTLLYRGNLNFSLSNPIEAIASYESENSQKVYWVDGLNQPRVLNILQSYINPSFSYNTQAYTYDPFSFTQEINITGTNSIQVSKQFFGGLFNAGVVQYAFCYFRKNLQETNIVSFTPLYYVSFSDRGEEPGKQVSCSFNITIASNGEDVEHFDYIRVFQIYSTSLNELPVVKIIKDIDTSILTNSNNYTYSFVDSNEFQVDTSTYDIQMIKQFIIPQTIVSKDDTLFLGNYKSNFVTEKTDLSGIGTKPTFVVDSNRTLQIDDASNAANVYKYKNQLDHSSREIKTFKYGEHYKFGVQFQNKYGQWSEPYYLDDVTNDKHVSNYNYNTGVCRIPYAQMSMSDIYATIMGYGSEEEKGYVKARPVVSFPTQNERLVLCQGVLNPTVFNLTDRVNGTTYAQASWFFRPYPSTQWDGNAAYKRKENNTYYYNGATCQFKHLYPLFPSDDIGCELQNMYFDSSNTPDNSTIGDLVATAIEKMWFLWGYDQLKAEAAATARATWGVGEDIKNDWALGTTNITSGTYSATGHAYWITAEVLESRYNQNNVTIGYLKLEVTLTPNEDYTSPHTRTVSGNINGAQEGLRPELPACSVGEVKNPTAIYQDYYYVDSSLISFNSPDLEFNDDVQSADMSQYSMRIIGYVPLLSNSGSYNINATTPLFKMNWQSADDGWKRGVNLPTGWYKHQWQLHNRWNYCSGHGILLSQGCWFDDINSVFLFDGVNHTGWNANSSEQQYFVHPWQRQYLNNYNHNVINSSGSIDDEITVEDIESGKINRKILANIKFSENTYYLESGHNLGLADTIKVYNFDQPVSLKIGNDKFYQGTVDQLVVTTSQFVGAGFTGNESGSTDQPEFATCTLQGYPIILGSRFNYLQSSSSSLDVLVDWYKPRAMCGTLSEYNYTPNESSMDPILMRYKSTPHAVFKMDTTPITVYGESYLAQNILPIGQYGNDQSPFIWNWLYEWDSDMYPLIWSSDTYTAVQQDSIPIDTQRGYLWIGEIYRNIKQGEPTPFTTNNDAFSLQQREWVVAGDEVNFTSNAVLKWLEGDTFYQRYDCLKTAPFSDEDYQSVVEILSFMCETRVNLDGRYDRNRGLLDNTSVDTTNFNLLNSVYNQENNFYTYNILDEDLFRVNHFTNQITWTLPKANGSKVDNWTKITLASTTDADGSRGEITALRKFKDDLYCFQSNGIGKLLYNERVQIPTSDGVPIEIGNSNKMQGVKYISSMVGCQNKWACKETQSGIYFVDNNNPGIYRVTDDDNKIVNLTKTKYMQKWFETTNIGLFGSWTPVNPTNGLISYDASLDEVLFTTLNDSLVYSPQLDCFVGFFSYTSPAIHTLEKYPITVDTNCKIYRLREGSYSYFYDKYKPFGLSIVAYPFSEGQFIRDCIYDNVWYKGDGFNSYGWYQPDEHFDTLTTSNEYQQGTNNLVYTNANGHLNTNLRKKFRLWYARIPRNARNDGRAVYNNIHTDRMRNPWLNISLYKNSPSGNQIRLQELMVDCYY